MQCLNRTLFALVSEQQRGHVVKAAEKQCGMLQNFWVCFSLMPIHLKCFEVGQV